MYFFILNEIRLDRFVVESSTDEAALLDTIFLS